MLVSRALDGLLELSIVGSFTRLGPAVRRRLFRWAAPPPGVLIGRTALVTGPTSGIGRAAVAGLAALGARVVLVGRSEERLAGVRDALVSEHGEDRFPIVVADMGSLDSVRGAIRHVLATEERLDVVVDNAGTIYSERIEGPDGIEGTLAVLVVGPFTLISGLLPLLQATPGSRVISTTSGGMYTQALDLDDLQWTARPYSGPRAYAQAKRAQTALSREWARRFAGTDVTFFAMHPGWADTRGLAETLPGFHRLMRPLLRTPAAGADSITWLATAPDASTLSGSLILDRRPRPFDRAPWTRVTAADRRRLWDLVVGLSGAPDPTPGTEGTLNSEA